ncbi:MAG: thioredoxin domain-containing protein [Bryobacterales bacterium]|nr:thioredoxin domain-containing protein [Bryobacterales bacterium]
MAQNRLAHEKSPYLLQHANNPVDWFPWGDEAFEKARREDKPVFLSVGYSTCHWCHVMERESFESEETARILNEHFVSIKVDREERPDIDRIYMLFVQATTGGGGWPMSVWLTPERKPFFGGTYFPPDNRYGRPGFPHLVEQIAEAWRRQRTQLLESGDSILSQLRQHSEVAASSARPDPQALDACFLYFRRTFDSRRGGFGDAPKFPRPVALNFLFRYHEHSGNKEALDMALLTLREMANGGMYDQLGGGFHRYSVDDRWFVPHFEKMLYDQAQLAISYVEAFQITGESRYAEVARGILDYVLRDMTHPDGGFYSAEDADSIADPAHPHEKGEGAFYIWSQQEFQQVLGERTAEWAAYRYGAEDDGNVRHDPQGEFTSKNILYLANTVEQTANRFGVNPGEMAAALEDARAKLLAARGARPRPHLDDKILTAWNGLMISALAKAGFALAEQRYIAAAGRSAHFVLDKMRGAGADHLYRRWRDGEPAIDGFLDDYALFSQGLIDLYEATFDSDYLRTALGLMTTVLQRFEDREQGGFYSAPPQSPDLVLQLKEDYDGAEPSGNSVAALNLLRLAQYTGNGDLRETANDLFRAFASRINNQPVTIPQMLVAYMFGTDASSQVVIAGDAAEFLPELRRRFRPHSITIVLHDASSRDRFAAWLPETVSMGPVDGKPAAYVCENFACQLPVTGEAGLRGALEHPGASHPA